MARHRESEALTSADCARIRALYAEGITPVILARRFAVTASRIVQIIHQPELIESEPAR